MTRIYQNAHSTKKTKVTLFIWKLIKILITKWIYEGAFALITLLKWQKMPLMTPEQITFDLFIIIHKAASDALLLRELRPFMHKKEHILGRAKNLTKCIHTCLYSFWLKHCCLKNQSMKLLKSFWIYKVFFTYI